MIPFDSPLKQLLLIYLLISCLCHLFIFPITTLVNANEGKEEENHNNNNNNLPPPLPPSTLNALKLKIRDEFDWTAYLEMNPDIGKYYSTREQAAEHYLLHGYQEGRVFPSLYPNQPGFSIAMQKLMHFVYQMDQQNIPKEQRTFVIFHVGIIDSKNSYEIVVNNLKLFNYSIVQDQSKNSHNFYWFNVIGGKGNNMESFVPNADSQWNIARLEWLVSPSDILMHLRTLNVVKNILELNFGSVFFMNNGVRGPMLLRENGIWLQEFRQLLSDKDHVGMAGPTISCEVAPHVQTHAYIMRTSLIPALLIEYTSFQQFKDWPALIRHYEVGMSQFVLRHGWNISSLLYQKRLGKNYFDGECIPVLDANKNGILNNPSRWCNLKPDELILYKFGGEMLRVSGFVCDDVREYMRKEIIRLSEQEMKSYELILPETIKGGPSFDLFKQYDLELQRDYEAKKAWRALPVVNRKDAQADKVCFLIRTAKMHDEKQTSPYGESITSGSIEEIVESLVRQTDSNWEAFFFLTDEKPFEARLQEILSVYKDDRLTFLDVPLEYRPPYSSTDAAYTPTDYVLRMLVHRKDCRWLTASNADNIYGSEIVERVRNVVNNPQNFRNKHHYYQVIPDLVITPLDSRNWAEIDYMERGSKSRWDENCIGIISNLKLNTLAATVQPRPIVGRVDLAAAFFSRPKLLAENLFFGNFTNPREYPCKGCQDGYLTEYLVNHRYWSYRRLAVDGLKSIVFHGPSPTWCIAAGNVWFDHPEVNKVRCYSQRTVDALRLIDAPPKYVFDWNHFDRNDRVCLRFSHHGFHRSKRIYRMSSSVKEASQWRNITTDPTLDAGATTTAITSTASASTAP